MTAGTDASKYLAGVLDMDTAALHDAVANLGGESYISGLLVAAQQTGTATLVAGLGEILPTDAAGWSSFWDSWKPGNIPAADLLNSGGLADLLAQTETTIKGIEGTTLDRLGNLLADGVSRGESVDTIAGSLGDYLDDPARAFMIADTEASRAVSQASMDGYGVAGVAEVDWLSSPGACELCMAHSGNSPFPLLDAPSQPAHPYCRCSYSPRDPGTGAVEVELEEADNG